MIKALLCFLTACAGLVHHWVITDGLWFQIEDMAHHEPIIVAFVALGIGILIPRK